MTNANGNGLASPVVHGANLALRKLTKSQRAVIAADIFDGNKRYQASQRELGGLLGVSVNMIGYARRLSPAARQQIMNSRLTLGSA